MDVFADVKALVLKALDEMVASGQLPFSGRPITRQSAFVPVMGLLLRLKFMATPVGYSVDASAAAGMILDLV